MTASSNRALVFFLSLTAFVSGEWFFFSSSFSFLFLTAREKRLDRVGGLSEFAVAAPVVTNAFRVVHVFLAFKAFCVDCWPDGLSIWSDFFSFLLFVLFFQRETSWVISIIIFLFFLMARLMDISLMISVGWSITNINLFDRFLCTNDRFFHEKHWNSIYNSNAHACVNKWYYFWNDIEYL